LAQFVEIDAAGRVVPGAGPRESDEIHGHGTHTAATLAGRPVKGKHVGTAPAAEIYSAMVIEGGDVVARVLGGLNWAIGVGVRVISMSLGIRGLVTEFLGVIDALRDNRILPVIAVGNEGPGTSRSPGNYPKALSVGSHDESFVVAGDSSSQRFIRRSQPIVPDLVAPGVDVISAKAGGGWLALSGTSMATPHVAGLVALLLEAKPEATVAKLERAIFASCQPGAMDAARSGRGAVNGPKALDALTG
jgi:subtilisin family serine protease